MKTELIQLIETLSENEIIYLFELTSKLFTKN